MSHEIPNLTINQGVISHTRGAAKYNYMALQPVLIKSPDRFTKLANGRIEYFFKLTGPTDPLWREFLGKVFHHNFRIESDELKLVCTHAELKNQHAELKEAMKRANQAYVEERSKLCDVLVRRDASQINEDKAVASEDLRIAQEFHELK